MVTLLFKLWSVTGAVAELVNRIEKSSENHNKVPRIGKVDLLSIVNGKQGSSILHLLLIY